MLGKKISLQLLQLHAMCVYVNIECIFCIKCKLCIQKMSSSSVRLSRYCLVQSVEISTGHRLPPYTYVYRAINLDLDIALSHLCTDVPSCAISLYVYCFLQRNRTTLSNRQSKVHTEPGICVFSFSVSQLTVQCALQVHECMVRNTPCVCCKLIEKLEMFW